MNYRFSEIEKLVNVSNCRIQRPRQNAAQAEGELMIFWKNLTFYSLLTFLLSYIGDKIKQIDKDNNVLDNISSWIHVIGGMVALWLACLPHTSRFGGLIPMW